MKNLLPIAILLFSLELPASQYAPAPKTTTQEVCAYLSAGYWKLTGFAFATECLIMAFQREFDYHWLHALILGTGNAMMFSMCAGDDPFGHSEEQRSTIVPTP